MLDTNVEEKAARVGKSLLADQAFVVLEKLGIFLLQEAPEQYIHIMFKQKYPAKDMSKQLISERTFLLELQGREED